MGRDITPGDDLGNEGQDPAIERLFVPRTITSGDVWAAEGPLVLRTISGSDNGAVRGGERDLAPRLRIVPDMGSYQSPLSAIVKGAIAGAAGTSSTWPRTWSTA